MLPLAPRRPRSLPGPHQQPWLLGPVAATPTTRLGGTSRQCPECVVLHCSNALKHRCADQRTGSIRVMDYPKRAGQPGCCPSSSDSGFRPHSFRAASNRPEPFGRSNERLRCSRAASWAWEDLNLRPHPERKIAVSCDSHPERKIAVSCDSHPSWRPPAMGVLSAIPG
jgi:hypothetical protein